MRFLLVAALIVAVAVADIDLEFEGKINLTDAAANFAFRSSKSGRMSAALLSAACKAACSSCNLPSHFYYWTSSSVNADTKKGVVDGMAAISFPPSSSVFPFSLLGYGTGTASLDIDITKLLTGLFSASSTGAFEGGAVGMAAFALEEVTPNNHTILNSIVPLNGACSEPKEIEGKVTKGMTCEMTVNNVNGTNDCKVIITYVSSKTAGILKYGKTPVSPRSIDMIIEVENFKLSDPKNHVRLTLGFVTASGDIDYDGNAKVIMKDNEKVYVAASGHVMVGDKRADVNVQVTAGSVPENLKTTFEAVAKAFIGWNLDVSLVNVDFPAGATKFIYDPACGSGSNVYKAGASTVTLSLLVLLVCSLLFILF